jgi:hypothetical protein
MEPVTIESIIAQIERAGWRLSSLSHINSHNVYSCILERKKPSKDGFGVYASSDLKPTACEAVEDAWVNARKPLSEINNPARKFVKGAPAQPKAPESLVENSPAAAKLEKVLRAWYWALVP